MVNRFVRRFRPRTSRQMVTILRSLCSFAPGVLMEKLNSFSTVATGVLMVVRTTTTTAIEKAESKAPSWRLLTYNHPSYYKLVSRF